MFCMALSLNMLLLMSRKLRRVQLRRPAHSTHASFSSLFPDTLSRVNADLTCGAKSLSGSQLPSPAETILPPNLPQNWLSLS